MKEDLLLIDVRENEEWGAGHIDGALLHPLSQLQVGSIPQFDIDRNIVVYCQRGIRSQQAATVLKAAGYLNVLSLAGGYEAWCENLRK